MVISAEEFCELLDSGVAVHNSRNASFTYLLLKKLSLKGKTGAIVRTNSTCISTRSMQGEGNYNNNWHSWRPKLECIPEDLTED